MENLTIYAVQGTGFTTTFLFNAIKKAKTKADKKAEGVITANGKLFATVNYRGVLKAA